MKTSAFPLVSIIIPFKDRFEFLYESLDSIKNQTYKNKEVILVDNASVKDAGQSIRKKYADFFGLQLIRNEKDFGPGYSRQKGFEASRGKYLIYLDSDDILDPEMILKCTEYMELNLEMGMCYVISKEFASSEDLKNQELLKIRKKSDQGITRNLIYEMLTHRRIWDTSACFWRKNSIKDFEPWSSAVFEDYIYDAQIETRGIQVGHIAEALCFYREHPEGIGKTREVNTAEKINKLLHISNLISSSPSLKGWYKAKLICLLTAQLSRLREKPTASNIMPPVKVRSPWIKAVVFSPFFSDRILNRIFAKIAAMLFLAISKI